MASTYNTSIAVGVNTSGMKRGIGQAQQQWSLFTRDTGGKITGLSNVAKTGALAIGAAFAGAFASSVQAAAQMEDRLAELNTILGDTENLDNYEAAARRMAVTFGSDVPTQVDALYSAVSSGFGTIQEASELLDAANRAATVGFAELSTAQSAITRVLSAYSLGTSEASRVSDILFTTVQNGETTLDQLGSSIGNVASLAAESGVTIEEMAAFYATATVKIGDTNRVTTGLRAILSNILKPTAQARDEAARLGISFDAAALKSQGLAQFLSNVIEATDGNTESLTQLFGSVEGLGSLLAATGGELEGFEANLLAIGEATGVVDEKFGEVSENVRHQTEALGAAIGELKLAFNDSLNGTGLLGEAMRRLTILVHGLNVVFFDSKASAAALAGDAFPRLEQTVRQAAFVLEKARENQSALNEKLREAGQRLSDVAIQYGVLSPEAQEVAAEVRQLADDQNFANRIIANAEENLANVSNQYREMGGDAAAVIAEVRAAAGAVEETGGASADAAPEVQSLAANMDALKLSAGRLQGGAETADASLRNFSVTAQTVAGFSLPGLAAAATAAAAAERQLAGDADDARQSIADQATQTSLTAHSKERLAEMAGRASASEISLEDAIVLTNAATDDQTTAAQELTKKLDKAREAARLMREENISMEEAIERVTKGESGDGGLTGATASADDMRQAWNNLYATFELGDTKFGEIVNDIVRFSGSIDTTIESVNTLITGIGNLLNLDFSKFQIPGLGGGGGGGLVPSGGGGGGGGGGGLGGLGGLGGGIPLTPQTAALAAIVGLTAGLTSGGYDGPGTDEIWEQQRLTATGTERIVIEAQTLRVALVTEFQAARGLLLHIAHNTRHTEEALEATLSVRDERDVARWETQAAQLNALTARITSLEVVAADGFGAMNLSLDAASTRIASLETVAADGFDAMIRSLDAASNALTASNAALDELNTVGVRTRT